MESLIKTKVSNVFFQNLRIISSFTILYKTTSNYLFFYINFVELEFKTDLLNSTIALHIR